VRGQQRRSSEEKLFQLNSVQFFAQSLKSDQRLSSASRIFLDCLPAPTSPKPFTADRGVGESYIAFWGRFWDSSKSHDLAVCHIAGIEMLTIYVTEPGGTAAPATMMTIAEA